MAEFIETINWSIVTPILIIQVILIIIALFDLRKAGNVNGPKWMWGLIIVFINIIGPVIYFVFGKKV